MGADASDWPLCVVDSVRNARMKEELEPKEFGHETEDEVT